MSHILQDANVFVTGGAGTLGRAIARRRQSEGWTGRFTVYSGDDHKHDLMRRMFPDSGIHYIQGDIRNQETLYAGMVGHDVVIHAAAVKVIPVSEEWSIDTIDVNVYGSQSVCSTAVRAGVKHVLGISTDKACHPANLYGATKMAMEKIWQEFSRMGSETQFHLVRYGNVLESTGSVIEAWRNAIARGEKIKMTDPDMTRFWLSPDQAAKYVVKSFAPDSGWIYVPLMPALSIGDLAQYVVGDAEIERIPLRPGEKSHETLVTLEELPRTTELREDLSVLIAPSTHVVNPMGPGLDRPYSSDIARRLTREELTVLLADA